MRVAIFGTSGFEIGDAVLYRPHRHAIMALPGVITGQGIEAGRVVYDVSLADGGEHWGYAEQFEAAPLTTA